MIAATLAISVGAAAYKARHTPAVTSMVAPLQTAAAQIAQSAPVQTINNATATVAAAIAEKPVQATREVEVDDGESFTDMLSNQGIADAEALSVTNALSKVYDLRDLKAGQDVTLSFLRTGQQETLTGVTFQPSDIKEITISRSAAGNSFAANATAIPVSHHRLAARGEIKSSLYEAGDAAGVPHAIMATLIRTYSHDIDFQRDVHPGDSFEVLYDQSITAKGKAVGEGTIIYAAMRVNGHIKPLYRVTFNDNSSDYFDESGHSLRRALLRTPVAAAHITSGYGMRVHPLLGYSKMHKGVDFGAPIGTPIFSAGSGTVEEIGFKNGFGRYIRIRHNNALETAYGHMSRFNASLYRGAHVNQGQVIAYVGMSGRATGPHLHFEVHVNGQQVNPMSVNLPTGRVLEGKTLAAFKQGQSKIKDEYATLLSQRTTSSTGRYIPASTNGQTVSTTQSGKL